MVGYDKAPKFYESLARAAIDAMWGEDAEPTTIAQALKQVNKALDVPPQVITIKEQDDG
jgi:hypothetical protein